MPVRLQAFTEAVRKLDARTPVASTLRSAEWADVPLALRERAFFSAGVDNIRTLGRAKQLLDRAIDPTRPGLTMDASRFVAQMRQELGAPEGDSGELTDITSRRRLELVYNQNTQAAYGFARYKSGQQEGALGEFPAQELFRAEERDEKRDWHARWRAAAGDVGDSDALRMLQQHGRMIARKDSPIWIALSRFGTPWPPFDFGSGMDVQDIDRDEAGQLGLLGSGDPVQPTIEHFNDQLEASVADIDPGLEEAVKGLFGDQIEFGRDGKLTWQGSRIQNLVETALTDDSVQWSLDLGSATPDTVAHASRAGVDLTDTRLQIDSDHIRHAVAVHGEPDARGPGTGETRPDQEPLTTHDFQMVPHVWRQPDSVTAGNQPGDLLFQRALDDTLFFATWRRQPNNTVRLQTLYKKRAGGSPAPRVGP